jgi:5-formyltetrahydrofolate cyclo-ligase
LNDYAGAMNLQDQKKAARGNAAAVRKVAHEALADSAGLHLASHEFPVKPEAGRSTVSAFHPFRSEIDTKPLIGKLVADGWTTCLPIILGAGVPLIFRRWFPGEPTVSGDMNIMRPLDDAPQVEPDVVIVPLLAFDREGYRLGYGGGFYDRTLAVLRAKKKITAIGVGYSAQQVPHVPHDELDQPVDFVMTESGIIKCG